VPGFPNVFLLYGPNTNFVLNGSAIFLSECEMSYILRCVELILAGGHFALDCRPEDLANYNRRIDGGNALMA
jgi:4-hydroxyacetophenone monooxygenase